jgi:uncharacterized protein YceH (UPF0502 family)
VLAERDFARRLERRPGQKEDRFEHLLGGGEQESGPALESPAPAPAAVRGVETSAPPPRSAGQNDLVERVESLEAEVAALREELAALREERHLGSAAEA